MPFRGHSVNVILSAFLNTPCEPIVPELSLNSILNSPKISVDKNLILPVMLMDRRSSRCTCARICSRRLMSALGDSSEYEFAFKLPTGWKQLTLDNENVAVVAPHEQLTRSFEFALPPSSLSKCVKAPL